MKLFDRPSIVFLNPSDSFFVTKFFVMLQPFVGNIESSNVVIFSFLLPYLLLSDSFTFQYKIVHSSILF